MSFLNLEHGFISQQSDYVNQQLREQINQLNLRTSQYLRHEFVEDRRQIIADLAAFCAVDPNEILLTRSCSEALQILLHGYPLQAGDQVICSAQDYDTVHTTLGKLIETKHIDVKLLRLPLVETEPSVYVELYENAITPATKLIILSHVCHRHGLILPVQQISAMAKRHQVDVLIDAAHSFALLNVQLTQLGADFIAVNLHKWFGGPIGTGLLYINKNRLTAIKPAWQLNNLAADQIMKLSPPGTVVASSILNIADALAEASHWPAKAKKLSALTQYWLERLASYPTIRLVTPDQIGHFCAIGAFYVEGLSSDYIVNELWRSFKILLVARQLYDLNIIRVTVGPATTTADLDYFINAMAVIMDTPTRLDVRSCHNIDA